ncbi:MAG: VWA domain-containing protein [Chloroflexi bacterium]|nr:VWA domain-containing protein [Chloroflexota bacterium]
MKFNRLTASLKIAILFALMIITQANGLAQSATELVAHYVEVTPVGDGITYKINLYFSTVDPSGAPMKDILAESLNLLEDSQRVEIKDIGPASEIPTNLVLVIDTSGTMFGARITDAQAAGVNLVTALMKPGSQVAVITFDNEIRTQINFTSDQKTITDGIQRISATRGAGACLYDAIHAAVQAVSTLPVGNRAVILLTDSRDETPSLAICSSQNINNVIKLASEGNTRTPIHTIGLGTDIDNELLRNIADQTGGYYLFSPDSPQLTNTIQKLIDRLNAQYILTYLSTASPGAHTLTLSVNQTGPVIKATRNFSLSPLPAHITFTTPLEGELVGDLLKIAVSLSTQGQTTIARVAFVMNGVEAGSDDTKPYELELDASPYPTGALTVSAVAYDATNLEVARANLNLVHAQSAEAPTSPAEVATAPGTATSANSEGNNLMVITAVVLSGISIFAIVFLLFLLLRQQQKDKGWNLENMVDDERTIPAMQRRAIISQADDHRKATSPEFESDALGVLTIEASDDSSLIDHRFEITKSLVTLGRSADNDVNFPGDKPVSRHHAEIYQISGKLYLREVETAGASGAMPPKYGTFVNQKALEADPVLLKTGDEIQLGKRVRLRFESFVREINADSPTSDDFDNDMTMADDIDKTALQD